MYFTKIWGPMHEESDDRLVIFFGLFVNRIVFAFFCGLFFQAAAYQPFFRAHSHLDTRRREPWLLPAAYSSAIRSAIISRYRLLPYWYWLFFDSQRTGAPVIRPMWVEFPADRSIFDADDQHFVGSALLVHPVTRSSVTAVDVYLPGDGEVRW